MGIDHINLTNPLRHVLFSKTLIETAKKEEFTADQLPAAVASLGENKKNILFLVNDTENKFVGEREMEMLTNLLTACRLTMEDIVLLNFAAHPLSYEGVNKIFHPVTLLIFGITPAQLALPFTIPFFQIQSFNNQTYMVAPTLAEFLDNTSLKGQLWNALKKIFFK